ncbi:MAG: restriction endonuclease [Chitinophagales bacterium]|nr:restriction endonuclease [Chitinophagales bacterium]
MNHLYFGDCLDILLELDREHNGKGFIDLIYIDPPFNSKRNYNVLFESIDLKDATAQKQAFADTWSNYEYLDTLNQISAIDKDLHHFLQALNDIRISDSAVAYLTTMSIRIYYMHKLLKDTGSFYLHCDPTMSHYLKLVCDLIFGEKNFRNEITWKRTGAHSDAKQGRIGFGNVVDIILFYTMSEKVTFNPQYLEHDERYVESTYKYKDANGRRYRLDNLTGPGGAAKGNPFYEFLGVKRYWRYSKEKMQKLFEEGRIIQTKAGNVPAYKRYLDESKGVEANNIWIDIPPLQFSDAEKLGYPTQKPVALLERIIKASTNEGDLVADFFCGCGTTIDAAEGLNRKWIGADISHLAIALIDKRLKKRYPGSQHKYTIKGFPKDIESAHALAEAKGGRMDFQEWVIEYLLDDGVLNQKKTSDGGWDGYITFDNEESKKEFVLIEVKSGNVNVKNLREFEQVVTKEKAALGIFVCFEEQVTTPMRKLEKESGSYNPKLFGNRYPKIQILTIEDLLLNHKQPLMPKFEKTTFKSAQKNKEGKGTMGMFD